ncbi:hypothetical protein [Streptomyces sp. TLI_105]|uniref:hypothetical protein n=1 Tax=Streptomyces sp. TLI_105 TaxID=1881019 RepID=UPI00089603FD|nr:hypothetical protein [Streptomyces sp. TLI_105]SEB61683.1 hypothetical protein SAMN05428939_0205 [Streptomyces sp. TLI_105]
MDPRRRERCSEPVSVFFDPGSGGHFHESIDWWAYDGTMRRPTATTMRGRCSCGWRSATTYPIDWEKARGDEVDEYDTSGPWADWEGHTDEVTARTLPPPEGVAGLLGQLRERLDEVVGEKAARGVEGGRGAGAIVASAGPLATAYVTGDETSMRQAAEALGTTEKAARSCLSHYEYLPR